MVTVMGFFGMLLHSMQGVKSALVVNCLEEDQPNERSVTCRRSATTRSGQLTLVRSAIKKV